MPHHHSNDLSDHQAHHGVAKSVYHQERQQHHPRARIPAIPDLRFEYSYLRSISHFITVERVHHAVQQHLRRASVDDLLEDYETVEAVPQKKDGSLSADDKNAPPQEVVHVQWKNVLWVTTRDQILSPLLQGAVWAIASYFLTPYSAQLGSKLGQFVHSRPTSKEGTGAGWLRDWVQKLGLAGPRSFTESKS